MFVRRRRPSSRRPRCRRGRHAQPGNEALDLAAEVVDLEPVKPEGLRVEVIEHALDAGGDLRSRDNEDERALLERRRQVSHNELAVALASQQELDGAIDQFRQTLELNPADAQARDGLALALRLKNSRGRVAPDRSAGRTVRPKG